MNIHYICNGNVFRSVIAEAYTNSLGIPELQATSSGAFANAHREANREYQPGVQQLLTKHGLASFYKPEPEQLTQTRLQNQNIVVCMNTTVHANAQQIVQLPSDTIIWDVADIGEGARIAHDGDRTALSEEVFNEIMLYVDQLMSALQPKKTEK